MLITGDQMEQKVAGERAQGRRAQFQERKKKNRMQNVEYRDEMKHEFIVASWARVHRNY